MDGNVGVYRFVTLSCLCADSTKPKASIYVVVLSLMRVRSRQLDEWFTTTVYNASFDASCHTNHSSNSLLSLCEPAVITVYILTAAVSLGALFPVASARTD